MATFDCFVIETNTLMVIGAPVVSNNNCPITDDPIINNAIQELKDTINASPDASFASCVVERDDNSSFANSCLSAIEHWRNHSMIPWSEVDG